MLVNKWFLLFCGGGLGTLGRYCFGLFCSHTLGTAMPWGTLGVNLIGSLLIGFLAAWLAHHGQSTAWSLFLITGVLGGFTTFSAFELELLNLIRPGMITPALAYAGGSVALGLVAVMFGYWLGSSISASTNP